MTKTTGLVIRSAFNMYCVCDGIDKDNPEAFAIGKRFSEWFDTYEQAEEFRRKIYDVISNELQEAANKFHNEHYESASKFLDAKYSI